MKITKNLFITLLAGSLLAGCSDDDPQPDLSPVFGFSTETPTGPIHIPLSDTLLVTLPIGYQTLEAEIKPLDPDNSFTPTRSTGDATERGDWQVKVLCDNYSTAARIVVSAEYPIHLNALLTVNLIGIDGKMQSIHKVIKRDTSSDYLYNQDSHTYTVRTANGLMMLNRILVSMVNDTDTENDNVNVTLAGDITLENGQSWTPIYDTTNPTGYKNIYRGTFNGAGHTIKNLNILTNNSYTAFIGRLDVGGVIKNLTIENCNANDENGTTAALVGRNDGTIADCVILSANLMGYSHTGGIAGINNGDIVRCSFFGNAQSQLWGQFYVGGIAGENSGIIDRCEVNAALQITGQEDVGGIAGINKGIIRNGTVGRPEKSNLTLMGNYNTGGIAGNQTYTGSIVNCSVERATIQNTTDDEYKPVLDSATDVASVLVGCNRGIIAGCLGKNAFCISPTQDGLVGIQAETGKLIACYDYQCMHSTDKEDFNLFADSKGIFGSNTGTITQCYYQGNDDDPIIGFDSQGATLAKTWAYSDVYGDGAMTRMNDAIYQYNRSSTGTPCNYRWGGEANKPTFIPIGAE